MSGKHVQVYEYDWAKVAVWGGALAFCAATWTGVIWGLMVAVQAFTG